jgi:predicted RNA-binding protein
LYDFSKRISARQCREVPAIAPHQISKPLLAADKGDATAYSDVRPEDDGGDFVLVDEGQLLLDLLQEQRVVRGRVVLARMDLRDTKQALKSWPLFLLVDITLASQKVHNLVPAEN